jgi:hypothetical protein
MTTTQSIKAAVKEARDAALARGVSPEQAHMVACLAVKAEMPDTLENLIALRDCMRRPGVE